MNEDDEQNVSKAAGKGLADLLGEGLASGAGVAEIVVIRGQVEVTRRPLDRSPIRVGRHRGNDLVLDDRLVSRRHAEIVREQGRWWIRDLGSRHKLRVAGQPCETHALQHGDRVGIGPFELVYQQSSERMPMPTSAPGVAGRRFDAPDALDARRPEPFVTDIEIPGYEIGREIGRGGMGRVYEAVQLSTRRTVALKVLPEGPFSTEKSKRRFEREVRIVAALRHPNIAQIYESGLHQSRHWFAMELVEGQPLDRAAQAPDFSLHRCLSVMASVCQAVGHAHEHKVIHRDLKPSNILISPDGQPHILDFGLAKIEEPQRDHEITLSAPGELMGTPAYMSPEQTEREPGKVDSRSDVYSLGVILYRLVTGEFPYEVCGRLDEVVHAIATSEPIPPSRVRRGIDAETEAIILKAIAKAPDDRYPAGREMAEDLGRRLAGQPVEAKLASRTYRFTKILARHRRYLLAASVLMAAVATSALATWAFLRFPGEETVPDGPIGLVQGPQPPWPTEDDEVRPAPPAETPESSLERVCGEVSASLTVPSGSSLAFDGFNDRVMVQADLLNALPLTIELWFWLEALPAEGCSLICNALSNHWGHGILVDAQGRLGVMRHDDWEWSHVRVEPQTWHQAAGVFVPGACRLYLDGQEIHRNSYAQPPPDARLHFWIGGNPELEEQTHTFTKGLIDEVRVWNIARTGEEMAYWWNRAVDSDTPGLVGYWTFDEWTGQTAFDATAFGRHGCLGADPSAPDGSDPVWLAENAPIISSVSGDEAPTEPAAGKALVDAGVAPLASEPAEREVEALSDQSDGTTEPVETSPADQAELEADQIIRELKWAVELKHWHAARDCFDRLQSEYAHTARVRELSPWLAAWRGEIERGLKVLAEADESQARQCLAEIKSLLDAKKYLQAYMALERLQTHFSHTAVANKGAQWLGILAGRVQRGIDERGLRIHNHYVWDPSPPESSQWPKSMADAQKVLAQHGQLHGQAAPLGLVVLRISLQNEGAEETCQIRGRSVTFWTCCWDEHGLKELKSGDMVIAGPGQGPFDGVRGIEIGTLYHYSPVIELEFQEGQVVRYGEIGVRSIPAEETGTLEVTARAENGLPVVGGRVKVGRFMASPYFGTGLPIGRDNRCVFCPIAPGKYRVFAEANEMFESPEQAVEVRAEEVTKVDLFLRRSGSGEIE